MRSVLDDPLASIGLRGPLRIGEPSRQSSCSVNRPLALRCLQPAPERAAPQYLYDPQRQIATDLGGVPLAQCH